MKFSMHSYLPNALINKRLNFNFDKLVKRETSLCGFAKVGLKGCYGEKFLWLGVPQQIDLTPEHHLSQYAIEIKCLTLKDQTSYLIPDG